MESFELSDMDNMEHMEHIWNIYGEYMEIRLKYILKWFKLNVQWECTKLLKNYMLIKKRLKATAIALSLGPKLLYSISHNLIPSSIRSIATTMTLIRNLVNLFKFTVWSPPFKVKSKEEIKDQIYLNCLLAVFFYHLKISLTQNISFIKRAQVQLNSFDEYKIWLNLL